MFVTPMQFTGGGERKRPRVPISNHDRLDKLFGKEFVKDDQFPVELIKEDFSMDNDLI